MPWSRYIGRPVMLVLLLSVMVFPSANRQASAGSAETPIDFDIQPQPLASALDRYGDATGREVVYDAALAEGRRSGAAQGRFIPATALRMLLRGTGLSAHFLADTSFVLLPNLPLDRQPFDHAVPPPVQQRYYARIQDNLRDVFCRSSAAFPGHYRVVALFWIGPSGNVQAVQRLSSAGSVDVDRGIDETLRGIKLDEPPPAGFKQPVLIMIVPQAPGVTMGCGSGSASLWPAGAEQP